MYGISTLTAAVDTAAFSWHGGEGMFSVVSDASFSASKVALEHDVSAEGESANWQSLGADAEFAANGQTLFTTGATSLRINFTGGGSEEYHLVVKPIFKATLPCSA